MSNAILWLLLFAVILMAVFCPVRITVTLREAEPPVRTPQEVRAWMEDAPWYPEWKSCLQKAGLDEASTRGYLDGDYLSGTVAGPFDWEDTPQGYDIWLERHVAFMNWFLRQEPSEDS